MLSVGTRFPPTVTWPTNEAVSSDSVDLLELTRFHKQPGTELQSETQVSVELKALVFSDGTKIELERDSIVVIVGPNNSGKSTALTDTLANLSGQRGRKVVKLVEVEIRGSAEDFRKWLENNTTRTREQRRVLFKRLNAELDESNIDEAWHLFNMRESRRYLEIAQFFCSHLKAEQRLAAAGSCDSFDTLYEAPSHPLHSLLVNSAREDKINEVCRRNFDSKLKLFRGAGKRLRVFWGRDVADENDLPQHDLSYLSQLSESVPLLEQQGDGIRSFVGTLLYLWLEFYFILLIDEPEAFLHPPQARELGRLMSGSGGQLIIATHSIDILRGLLERNHRRLKLVRLVRTEDVNGATFLEGFAVRDLATDAMTRHSGLLDGLFHDIVALCEGDSDCVFFQALYSGLQGHDARRKDVLFVNVGGKGGFSKALGVLRALKVPVRLITDFDMLNSKEPLATLVEDLGGSWSTIEADWKLVHRGISDKASVPPSIEGLKEKIGSELSSAPDPYLDKDLSRRLTRLVKLKTPWLQAKKAGESFIPQGPASEAFVRIRQELESLGVFVIPTGEVESFARSVPGHGPEWLRELFERHSDLAISPDLKAARSFLSRVLDISEKFTVKHSAVHQADVAEDTSAQRWWQKQTALQRHLLVVLLLLVAILAAVIWFAL